MNEEKKILPWEKRELFQLEASRNRAISAEQFQYLRQLIQFDYEKFWAEAAKDLHWFKPWKTTLEGGIPERAQFNFFAGGYSNVCFNMLDKHLLNGAGNRMALIWENESGERVESYTYKMLYNEVCKFSNALREHGIKKGDRIAFFLPNSPAAAIAVLAAYRLGVIFTPLFTGFSVDSLRARLNSFQPSVMVTMDGTSRRGNLIPLKSFIDETLKEVESVKTVIVKKNTGNNVNMLPDRDLWWEDIIQGMPSACPPTLMEANEIQVVLYTSGTAGKPKGAAIAGIGLAVQKSLAGKIESALIESDVYYSINDNCWAGSQCHAILPVWLLGATMVWQEGAAFSIPTIDRFYRTIEKYGANKVHLAPTVLRMLRAAGEERIIHYDLSGLELMLCMGEPLSPELWEWTVKKIGNGNLYLNNIGDMTEIGGCIIQPAAFIDPMKPGAMGRIDSLLGGVAVGTIDDNGKEIPLNSRGNLIFKRPLPGSARTLWKENDRYLHDYFKTVYDGSWVWVIQDEAVIDEDGFVWVLGRTDDVINIAGHRISTSEIESVITKFDEVEAAAVIGIPDPIKEQVPVGFIQLKESVSASEDIVDRIIDEVIIKVGKYAKLEETFIVKQLPTTISGKIMRRILRDIRIHGKISGDVSTVADIGVVDALSNLITKRIT